MIIKCPVTAEDYVEWSVDEADKKVIRVLGVSNIISFYLLTFVYIFLDHF